MSIRKPEANPIVALLLTWFVLGLGHLIVNGQQRKWLFTLIAAFIGSILCVLPGIIMGLLSVIEAYKTAQRLQAGEEIGDNEYSFKPLFSIIKIIDKTATFAA
jgi:hypothetical protein